jgi:hypothetical protein
MRVLQGTAVRQTRSGASDDRHNRYWLIAVQVVLAVLCLLRLQVDGGPWFERVLALVLLPVFATVATRMATNLPGS